MAYRDEINKSMFSVVKEEFLKVEVALEAAPRNPFLTKRRKGYLAILQRLKTESHIREDLRPKMFPTLTFTSEMKIMEAA
jgi:hypothetical protein